MLDIKDAIRIEKFPIRNTTYKVYVFNCTTCSGEVRCRKTYFKEHSTICRICAPKITIKSCHATNRLRPYEAKYKIFKKRCPETNLSYEDYLEFTKIPNCSYCDMQLPWQAHGENNPGFWLDRKTCSLGHIKGNLVTCCGLCNMTKRNAFSYEEFMLLAPALKQIRLARYNKE